MPSYYWIVSNDNYSKVSTSSWKYQRDKLVLTDDGAIDDFISNNNSGLLNFKEKTAGQTGGNRTKDNEIMVP